MSVDRPDLEVIPPGTRSDRLSKGSFVQNMERYGVHWRTRKGFGQVGQFDSTLGRNSISLSRHLGSHIFKTNFGNEQILTVFQATVFTSNSFTVSGVVAPSDTSSDVGQWLSCFLVTIYDLTTQKVWEELVYPKTSEDTRASWFHHGLYETDLDVNYETYTSATPEEFFFEELDDTIFFGNRRAGLLAYIPTTFHTTKWQQVNGVDRRDWHFRGESETSMIVKASAVPGLHADGYEYLTSSEFPNPTDITTIDGRMVFVDGRNLWFSDRGAPTSIITLNFITIPSQNDAVAVTVLHGNLVIFTESERFLYQPAFFEQLITAGEVLVASTEIGVVGPNALKRVGSSLVFVDRTGLYTTGNGYDHADFSETNEVKDFWRTAVESPLTSYFQNTVNPGFTDLSSTQPSLQYQFDPVGCHIEYDHVRDALMVAFPTQDMAFVWSHEDGPSLGQDNLFLVGSVDSITTADDIAGSTETKAVGSYYVLEYGRGGGPDRTLDYGVSDTFTEDDRRVVGRYSTNTPTAALATGDSCFYLEKWIRMPDGWVAPNGVSGLNNTYLVPLEFVPDPSGIASGNPPDIITLILSFDRTKWAPVLRPTTTELDFMLPPERLQGAPGWGQGAPTAGTREVQVYAGGVPNAAGNELRIRFNGNIGAYAGFVAPLMNLSYRQKSRLLYLPFSYAGAVTDDVWSIGFTQATTATFQKTAGGTVYGPLNCRLHTWGQGHTPGVWKTSDVDAQPVDWVLHTGQIAPDSHNGNPTPSGGLMARSLFVRMSSHGRGETLIVPSAVFGLLNAAVGSDWKGWTSQVVDYVGDDPSFITNHMSIRTRMKDAAGAMQNRTFNGTPTWGDSTDNSDGNFLVDSEQVDTIVFSDSVRGEHLFWMLFGHVNNRAERISIESMMARIVRRGGRRRRGR